MDEKFCGNVVHLRVSSLWKAKFRTRSLHEKKVCVFLFLNCLHLHLINFYPQETEKRK